MVKGWTLKAFILTVLWIAIFIGIIILTFKKAIFEYEMEKFVSELWISSASVNAK
jgi:hypothetical protein